MADKKYISKVKIGGENYSFRDTEALAAAQQAQHNIDSFEVPVNGVTDDIVFKDSNGKFYKLALTDKKVKLVSVTYSAPTASTASISWNGSQVLTRSVDDISTGNVEGALTGQITTTNSQKPSVEVTGNGVTNTLAINGDASPYTISGTVTIPNNGTATIKFTAKGATVNPSTGSYESATQTTTIRRTSTVESGVIYNASEVTPISDISGGFKFVLPGSGTGTGITPTTQAFANNTTVTLTLPHTGYVYIFTNAPKSFVLSTDKATVDSSKLGGGVVDLGTAQTYSISKTYYAYRSLSSFASGTKVYVKSIV